MKGPLSRECGMYRIVDVEIVYGAVDVGALRLNSAKEANDVLLEDVVDA
jgi:hypothetical protein